MIGNIEFTIRKNYKKLRLSEKKVADFILSYKGDYEDLTIIKLSKQVGVSQPTIIRFANSINVSGFKELKYLLIQEQIRKDIDIQSPISLHGFHISENDQLQDVPSNVIATTIKIMRDTLQSISMDNYTELIKEIIKSKRVFVFGVENSNCTVSDLVTKLLYLGINCITYNDYYLQSICANNLKSDDIAIAISYSGCSKNTIDVLQTARKSGAVTAAITNFEKAIISSYADINIIATTEQYMYGEAIFSRTSQIAIVDMIYIGILISNYNNYTQIMDNSSKVICDRAYK